MDGKDYSYFLKQMVALCPPKPKEFESATLTFALLASFGTYRDRIRVRVLIIIVGGTIPSLMVSR